MVPLLLVLVLLLLTGATSQSTLDLSGQGYTSWSSITVPSGTTELILQYNELSSFDGAGDVLPYGLTLIDLSFNNFVSVSFEGVTLPDTVQTILLANNQIESLAGCVWPASVSTINLNYNVITSLAGVTWPTSSSKTIDIQFNNALTSLQGAEFGNALQLNLSFNKISDISNAGFGFVFGLELQNNDINSLNGITLTTTYLSLANNKITSLQGAVIAAMVIDVTSNKIEDLTGLQLNNDVLDLFVLRGNPLQSLSGIVLPTSFTIDAIGTQLTTLCDVNVQGPSPDPANQPPNSIYQLFTDSSTLCSTAKSNIVTCDTCLGGGCDSSCTGCTVTYGQDGNCLSTPSPSLAPTSTSTTCGCIYHACSSESCCAGLVCQNGLCQDESANPNYSYDGHTCAPVFGYAGSGTPYQPYTTCCNADAYINDENTCSLPCQGIAKLVTSSPTPAPTSSSCICIFGNCASNACCAGLTCSSVNAYSHQCKDNYPNSSYAYDGHTCAPLFGYAGSGSTYEPYTTCCNPEATISNNVCSLSCQSQAATSVDSSRLKGARAPTGLRSNRV